MKRIKVLHIIKSLGRGGAEMLLQETLKEHDLNRFEFHYIYFLPWKDQMVEGLKAGKGIVKPMPAKNNLLIMTKYAAIVRYIKENQIDLVHAHLPWAGFVSRLVHRFSKVPVIYSEHNIQDRYHWLTKKINRITFNWQTSVIAVSGDVAESIQKRIQPKIPVQTILNGVNTKSFVRDYQLRQQQREKLGIGPDDILIGTIAVFRFQKRLKEWIDVIQSLQQQHPRVKACIVGDGILKPEIMAHVRERGMEDRIIFPGLQTDVKPWLSAFDIFMMTSSFEGLPIALLEAMSMECAVVCTDAGGIKELIRNGEDGFLVPVDAWQEIEKPLEKLITHPEQLVQYGRKARSRVESAFSMKNMVHQIENCYEQTLLSTQKSS